MRLARAREGSRDSSEEEALYWIRVRAPRTCIPGGRNSDCKGPKQKRTWHVPAHGTENWGVVGGSMA